MNFADQLFRDTKGTKQFTRQASALVHTFLGRISTSSACQVSIGTGRCGMWTPICGAAMARITCCAAFESPFQQ